jgi:hypothetical protein
MQAVLDEAAVTAEARNLYFPASNPLWEGVSLPISFFDFALSLCFVSLYEMLIALPSLSRLFCRPLSVADFSSCRAGVVSS